MENDGVKEGKTTVAQFTATRIYVPAPSTLRSGFATLQGTSAQTGTMWPHFTDNKQPQCNMMFALAAAAFNSRAADLYLAAPFSPSNPISEMSGVQVPGELSSERASAPISAPPSPPVKARSKIAPEGRADDTHGVYVQRIIVSPPSAPNNALVTFKDVDSPYMLSGEVTALMQILLFAKMKNVMVDAYPTGYVVDGHGYIDFVIINL